MRIIMGEEQKKVMSKFHAPHCAARMYNDL